MEHVAARTDATADDHTSSDQDVAIAARLALLEAHFGAAFAGDGQTVARQAIAEAISRDEQLRRVPLANSDEPVGSFVPHRPTDRGDAG